MKILFSKSVIIAQTDKAYLLEAFSGERFWMAKRFFQDKGSDYEAWFNPEWDIKIINKKGRYIKKIKSTELIKKYKFREVPDETEKTRSKK